MGTSAAQPPCWGLAHERPILCLARAVWTKVALDQLMLSPILTALFYGLLKSLEGEVGRGRSCG